MVVVIDVAGRPIRVRDLEADIFGSRYDEDPRFVELDKRLRAYWEDF